MKFLVSGTLAALFLVSVPLHAQEFRDDWAGLKEGSWTQLYKKKFAGAFFDWNLKETVKSVGPNELQLESSTWVLEDPKIKTRTISLKGLPGSSQNSGKKAGEETLECEGKKYKCTMWDYVNGDRKIRTWESKEVNVPGNALKTEETNTSDGEKSSRKAIKLEETIKVGAKDLKCTLFEVETTSPKVIIKGKTWLCADVPGLEVKSELSIAAPGKPNANELWVELRDFEKK